MPDEPLPSAEVLNQRLVQANAVIAAKDRRLRQISQARWDDMVAKNTLCDLADEALNISPTEALEEAEAEEPAP